MHNNIYFPLDKCMNEVVEVEYYYDHDEGDNITPPHTAVEIHKIWCGRDILEIMENYTIGQLKEELIDKIISYESDKE